MTPASKAHFHFIYQKWFTSSGFHTHTQTHPHTHTQELSCQRTVVLIIRKPSEWEQRRSKGIAFFICVHWMPPLKDLRGSLDNLQQPVNEYQTVERPLLALDWAETAALLLEHFLSDIFSPFTHMWVCVIILCWDVFHLIDVKKISWYGRQPSYYSLQTC